MIKVLKCLNASIYVFSVIFTDWYHADALELEESKIFDVLGFKCCKCRRIKSPVCPYSDLKPKMQEGSKKHARASKKDHSGKDDSGIISELKECEPATPNFRIGDGLGQDNEPLLFSLSSAELITEPNKTEVDVERNAVSGPGPQKLPVRRHVKLEGDVDDSFGSKLPHADFLTHNGTSNLSAVEKASSPSVEYDSSVCLDSNLLNDCENVNYEFMEFEPHTYFSVTELLQPDDNQCEGADISGELSGYLGNSCTMNGIPEECGAASLVDKQEPGTSLQGIVCCQCSQMEPAPDLFCEICGLWIHSYCSPWVESPSRLGSWSCGNCREWQ